MAKQSKPRTQSKGGETKRYNVLAPHSYTTSEGEEKTVWTDVGIGFAAKNGEGMNVEIRTGIAVSGRLVIRPWSKKEDETEGELPQFRHEASARGRDLV